MTGIPRLPPEGPRCTAAVPLRFEDVAQDGRLVLEALPTALATTVWRGLLSGSDASRALGAQGIVPILARLRMEGTPGPFSASASVEAEGTFRFGPAGDGRFRLDMWADLHAPVGRTYGAADRAGQRALAGRVLAEHVLTRPFAAAAERRVTSFDFAGAPATTETLPALPRFEAIATMPEGATPLEPAMRPDPVALAFGVVHTDSNRHVNSLVYLRVFEEAALRRFVAIGRRSDVLARTVDIGYRKPCFAGQVMRVVQQAFEAGGRLGVIAVLVTEPEAATGESLASARPHAYVRMSFET
ncbi:MAG TPA: hypothetical protein VN894_03470 [Polyangiaceae bacterium]|nr:hypothetical protein [Polyangiaceae bacterium]